jgi:hypothetical protein
MIGSHDSPLEIYRDHTGEDRVLGQVPPPEGYRVHSGPPLLLLPEDQWQEFEIDDPTEVKDQNGKGACNGHAAASSLELARWIAGQPNHPLSAWFIYAILCNGIDRGSNIGQALELLTATGTCLDGSVPYATINPRRLSAAARAEATRNRVEIGSMMTTFEELMTATQLRRPFNFSIRVGGGFDDLDADGCPRVSPGACNHAIAGGYGAKRGKDGRWLIKWKNSWATRWGLNGYAWIHAGHVKNARWFEAYCVAAATEDEGDDSTPPPAPEA